jgi:hypothetical protein
MQSNCLCSQLSMQLTVYAVNAVKCSQLSMQSNAVGQTRNLVTPKGKFIIHYPVMSFDCPVYADLRQKYSDLFHKGCRTLAHLFYFDQDYNRLAKFLTFCRVQVVERSA